MTFATPISKPVHSVLITKFLQPEELIETCKGTMPAAAWLMEERIRFAARHIICDLVLYRGKLALRRLS